MSDLDQLIQFAHEAFCATGGIPALPHDSFEATRRDSGMTVSDFLDRFARQIAHQYFEGDLSFEVADCAINSLSSYCLSKYEVMLPSYANDVYLAFDQGEFIHAGDEVGSDPEEKYTKSQIRAIVVRDQILGAFVETA